MTPSAAEGRLVQIDHRQNAVAEIAIFQQLSVTRTLPDVGGKCGYDRVRVVTVDKLAQAEQID